MKNKIFNLNDGGRIDAGYKGVTGDCVVRAIAIAVELPYQEVYDTLYDRAKYIRDNGRCQIARDYRDRGCSPRTGVHRKVYDEYLKSMGWKWKPTMQIGSGCKVHLRSDELPSGRIITRLSRHVCAVIDGVIQDTYDPSRNGTRCVYGYYYNPNEGK